MRLLTSPRSATLFEQAVVSATGFLSMLFFARHLSTLDWATFSFAAGLLLLSQGMQLSIVILPMISFSQGRAPSESDQLNWTWMNRVVLASMLLVCTAVGWAVLSGSASWMGKSCLVAALLIPPAFSYEYLRRRLILAGRYNTLAQSGAAYAAGVGAGVGCNLLLDGTPILAALTYWAGMAAALVVAGVRDPLRWSAPDASWLRPLRAFAPPAVGSSLAFAGYNLAVQAILGGVSGAAAVASFNATRMLMQPVNTLIGAFNNLDLPGAARAYVDGGPVLIRFQGRSILRLLLLGGAYLLVLALLADPVLKLLFEGRYSDKAILWGWLIVGLLMLVVTPTENVFYVTRRPRLLFFSRLAAAAVGCACAFWLVPTAGAVGAVLSIAAGWLVALLGGCIGLWSVRGHGAAGHAGRIG